MRCTILATLAVLAAAAPAAAAPPTATPLQTVAVDGAELGYRDINPNGGDALVLVAGYGVTMAEWDPAFVERLAQDRRVVVFDNRGLGTSTGSTAGLTIGRMADDAAGLVEALRLRRPDVLGWSMGGYIAQELALDRRRLVGKLVLASTDPGSPRARQPSAKVVATLTGSVTTPTSLLPVLFPADRQSAGEAWLAGIGAQPGLSAADFATPASTMREQTLASGPRWYGRGHGTYARLPRLRAPALIAYGREDVVVPPANARLLERRIPRATLRGYADAGHAFLFQNPTAKAAAFAAWLDRR